MDNSIYKHSNLNFEKFVEIARIKMIFIDIALSLNVAIKYLIYDNKKQF